MNRNFDIFHPVGSLRLGFSTVSCRFNNEILVYTIESVATGEYVELHFSGVISFRVTCAEFRGNDLANRFIHNDSVIYSIEKSSYVDYLFRDSSRNSEMNNPLYHCLLNLEDEIVDIILSVADFCFIKDGEMCRVNLAMRQNQRLTHDLQNDETNVQYKEEYLPVTIFHEQDEIYSSYNGKDLCLSVSSHPNDNILEITIPDVLAFQNKRVHGFGNKEIEGGVYWVKNSSYVDWLAESGYRQLYGEPNDIYHISVCIKNMTYDAIILSDSLPYYILNNKQYIFTHRGDRNDV